MVLHSTSGRCPNIQSQYGKKEPGGSFLENVPLLDNATRSMNISYTVTFPKDSCCPVMHFTAFDLETKPQISKKRCFVDSDKLIPDKHYVSLQDVYSNCSHIATTTSCTGNVVFSYIKPRRHYVSFGYECGREKPLNLTYDLCISEVIKTECQKLNYDETCNKYTNESDVHFPNVFGHRDQEEVLNNHRHLKVLQTNISKKNCYKHISSFLCKSLYPTCTGTTSKAGEMSNQNGAYVLPCRQMCEDLFSGCRSVLEIEGVIDCNNYPSGLPPATQCAYLEVVCPSPPIIANGTLSNSGTKLHDIAEYSCNDVFYLNGSRTIKCLPSGQWDIPPRCEIPVIPSKTFPLAIVISCPNIQGQYGNKEPGDSFLENTPLLDNATRSMNISYTVTFPKDSCCPVMHFTAFDLETQPQISKKRCFVVSDKLIPDKHYVSLQDIYSNCSHTATTTSCTGNVVLSYIKPRRHYVSFGYECGREKPLNLTYDLCISEVIKTECQKLNYDETCNKYTNESDVHFPNVFGHRDQEEVLNNRRHLDVLQTNISKKYCYKHISSFLCKSLYPTCTGTTSKAGDTSIQNGAYVLPCRQMCEDLFSGCRSVLEIEGVIDCNNYPSGFPPATQCAYLEVVCPSPPIIANGTRSYSGIKLHDIAKYSCNDGYFLNGSREIECLPSGMWDTPPRCDISIISSKTFPLAIVISCSILFVFLLTAAIIFGVCLKRGLLRQCLCLKRGKVTPLINNNDIPIGLDPRVFISFSTENRAEVDNFIGDVCRVIPECEYFTYQDDFLGGEVILDCIRRGIWESNAVIIFLTQDFIDSAWCLREFDEAYRRKKTEVGFRLIIVLDVFHEHELYDIPEDLRTYLKSNIYLLRTELQFWDRLRNTLRG